MKLRLKFFIMVNFSRAYDKANNLVGFEVITIGNEYHCEDMYGNRIYVAKTTKQAEVQELFLSEKIASCKTILAIGDEVRRYFKRK